MRTSSLATEPLAVLRTEVQPFHTEADDARVLSWIGDAPIVLLGESSHGTQDFYEVRARLSRKLIEQRGFSAVAVEGDWPDAYRVNRYAHGADGPDAPAALAGFERFPTWMWRNCPRRGGRRVPFVWSSQ